MYIQGLCQSRLSTADRALLLVAPATTAVKSLERSYAWPPPTVSLLYFNLNSIMFSSYIACVYPRKCLLITLIHGNVFRNELFPRIHLRGNVFINQRHVGFQESTSMKMCLPIRSLWVYMSQYSKPPNVFECASHIYFVTNMWVHWARNAVAAQTTLTCLQRYSGTLRNMCQPIHLTLGNICIHLNSV
jgi:hypothetical protein